MKYTQNGKEIFLSIIWLQILSFSSSIYEIFSKKKKFGINYICVIQCLTVISN